MTDVSAHKSIHNSLLHQTFCGSCQFVLLRCLHYYAKTPALKDLDHFKPIPDLAWVGVVSLTIDAVMLSGEEI